MTEGFRPLGQHGVRRHGTCGLCGVVGPRSRTHVPPHAAGNDQPSSMMGTRPEDGLSVVRPGRRRDGGSAGWFLCESCNGIAGRFDEEFVRWWKMLVMDWPNTAARRSGESRVGVFPAVRPGAFNRSNTLRRCRCSSRSNATRTASRHVCVIVQPLAFHREPQSTFLQRAPDGYIFTPVIHRYLVSLAGHTGLVTPESVGAESG